MLITTLISQGPDYQQHSSLGKRDKLFHPSGGVLASWKFCWCTHSGALKKRFNSLMQNRFRDMASKHLDRSILGRLGRRVWMVGRA